MSAQVSTDSVEILRLLRKEGTTWRMGDIKGHSDCWKQSAYNRVWVTPLNGKTIDIPASMILNPAKEMAGRGGMAILNNFIRNRIIFLGKRSGCSL